MRKGKGLKFGVIGLGVMGCHHARILSSLPGAKLTAIADIDPQKIQEKAHELKIKAFDNYLAMLNEVDAVCIATPTLSHFEIAQQCINAGKHVLLEKPFTGQSKLAKELFKMADERNVLLSANFLERFNPAYQRLLRLLKNEKIIGIDIKRLSPFPERITDTNVIFDMMIHDLDLLQRLIVDEIEDIRAEGKSMESDKLDWVKATITYKSGIIANVEANRIFGIKTRKIAVTTEKHLIDADLLKKAIYVRDFSTPVPSTVPVKNLNQLAEILKDFVSAIKSKEKDNLQSSYQNTNLPTGQEIIATLQLAERIEACC